MKFWAKFMREFSLKFGVNCVCKRDFTHKITTKARLKNGKNGISRVLANTKNGSAKKAAKNNAAKPNPTPKIPPKAAMIIMSASPKLSAFARRWRKFMTHETRLFSKKINPAKISEFSKNPPRKSLHKNA